MEALKNFTLYTVGHSNHNIEYFVSLLKHNKIDLVADVRSTPFSRWCPQFNKKALEGSLKNVFIQYLFLGKELGARPSDESYYNNGHVDYEHLAAGEAFQNAIKLLLQIAADKHTALMCAEKDPIDCHRAVLICKYLKKYNINIKHILLDGTLEDNSETEKRMLKKFKIEPGLFEQDETPEKRIEKAYKNQEELISRFQRG